MRKFICLILVALNGFQNINGQVQDEMLSFKEYLALVQKYHPVVKQAQLVVDESQSKLLKSRGAFDPNIAVDLERKKFEGTEYYDRLNAAFKIPTWYGIEVKANFEEASGTYLNPEYTVPQDGLYSAGISFSVAQGLLINERMATLKQAKFFVKQAKADRELLINEILYDATISYFDWLKSYGNLLVYEQFLDNAALRFDGIKQSVEVGERAAIDSIEARIIVSSRRLSLEKAKVDLLKKQLDVANFLWLDNNIPLEMQENVIPELNSLTTIENTLNIVGFGDDMALENHPKMRSLNFKYESLKVNKNLKANKLLPKIDLQYNFLSENYDNINAFNTANYKSSLTFKLPLFLRKERGDLKLAKLKLRDTKYDIATTELNLQNKIRAVQAELISYESQIEMLEVIVSDYGLLLNAEDRKFGIGESSIFLVNSRETKLIEAKIKLVELNNTIANTKANYFKILAGNPLL
ncbi:TolC family protein [Flavobacteriaceae sp. LMIT009]